MVKKKIFLLFLLVGFLIIFLSISFVFQFRKETSSLGVPGEVEETTTTSNFGKIKVELEENQKKAFTQVYPEIDLSSLIQISGVVKEVNIENQIVKIATGESEGWVKIAPNWHGNILTKNQQGEYEELTIINLSKGDWIKMSSFLNKSLRVLFLCKDKTCKETISGHIYLD